MANLKITDLAALTDPVSTDVLPIVDVAGDATKKVTIADLLENAGAGSAGSPSFSFDGDSDTGLFRSAANSLAITTAGTQRVTVNSSGNVGIGTDNPATKLEVYGDGRFKATDGSHGIELYPDISGLGYQRIISYNRTSSAYEDLSIGVSNFIVTNGSSSETLRIDSSGNVGIGTSSPQAKLHVQGDQTTKIKLQSTANGRNTFDPDESSVDLTAGGMNTTSKYTPSINFGSTDTSFTTTNPKFGAVINAEATETYSLDTRGGMKLNFWTSPNDPGTGHGLVQRMVIDEDGNVGIGTSSPSYNLEVQGVNDTSIRIRNTATSSADDTLLRLQNGGTTASNYIFFGDSADSDAGYIRYQHSDDSLQFRVNASERLRVDSSGNVCIGTSSAEGTVHLQDSTPRVVFQPTGDTQDGRIDFRNTASTFKGSVRYKFPSDSLEFHVNGSQKAIIDSSGNLGIGTSSPGVKLVVSGTDAIQVPAGTTAQRPTAAAGQIRLNTTHGYYEGYDGTNWTNLRTLIQAYQASSTQSCDSTSYSTITVIDSAQSLSDSLTTESAGVYTFARAGVYEIYIGLTIEGTAANYRWTGQLIATKNGTSTIIGQTKGGYIRDSVGSTETFLNMTFVNQFAAGNTVRFRIKRISDVSGTATIQSSTLSNVIIKALKTTD